MLTAQGPFISLKTSAAEWAGSMVVGLLLFAVLAVTTVNKTWATPKSVANKWSARQ